MQANNVWQLKFRCAFKPDGFGYTVYSVVVSGVRARKSSALYRFIVVGVERRHADVSHEPELPAQLLVPEVLPVEQRHVSRLLLDERRQTLPGVVL